MPCSACARIEHSVSLCPASARGLVRIWLARLPRVAGNETSNLGSTKLGITILLTNLLLLQLSPECVDLLDQMLHTDPRKRISAAAVLEHPWVTG